MFKNLGKIACLCCFSIVVFDNSIAMDESERQSTYRSAHNEKVEAREKYKNFERGSADRNIAKAEYKQKKKSARKAKIRMKKEQSRISKYSRYTYEELQRKLEKVGTKSREGKKIKKELERRDAE